MIQEEKKERNYTRIPRILPSYFPPTRLREYSPEYAPGEKYNHIGIDLQKKNTHIYINTFQICDPRKKKKHTNPWKLFRHISLNNDNKSS